MEPDEAAERLRELAEDDRTEILEAMPVDDAQRLSQLLGYAPDTAGGLMTTLMVTVTADETVAGVRERLRGEAEPATRSTPSSSSTPTAALVDDVSVFEPSSPRPTTLSGTSSRRPARRHRGRRSVRRGRRAADRQPAQLHRGRRRRGPAGRADHGRRHHRRSRP